MIRFIRPVTIIIISLLIALFSAAVTFTAKISGSKYSTTAALFLQPPTPPAEKDRSVIGSTDGIVVMGAVIVLIVLVPIIVQRKLWGRTE